MKRVSCVSKERFLYAKIDIVTNTTVKATFQLVSTLETRL
jgi:hypothetical protein